MQACIRYIMHLGNLTVSLTDVAPRSWKAAITKLGPSSLSHPISSMYRITRQPSVFNACSRKASTTSLASRVTHTRHIAQSKPGYLLTRQWQQQSSTKTAGQTGSLQPNPHQLRSNSTTQTTTTANTMSETRRFAERQFILEESLTQNNGARTIFIEHMKPKMTVPPHYHSRFAETFDLISGSMTVYMTDTPDLAALEGSAQEISIGKHVTVPADKYHKFLAGDEDTVLRVILTPGDESFEQLLAIMNGLADDGELEAMTDSPPLMAVAMDLADAHVIGPAGEGLNKVRKEQAKEVEEMRAKMLEKYGGEEGKRKVMKNDFVK